MADDDKTTSAWYKVPTWDGSPVTWRAFRKEMSWWVSSLDLESTRKYNLAARWLLRQSGIVRQRGEEFSPEDLTYQKEVRAKDPEGVEIIVTPEDLLAGLNKLLKALEGMNGTSALDKKGELRKLFYNDLMRKPGERPADFLSRFRFLAAELKSEGIELPSSELGWFLREKLGLDPLRKQLLETALQGKERFEDVESEALRLFKDLHAADPLMRRLGPPDKGRGRPFGGYSSSSSTASSVYRGASTGSVLSRAPSGGASSAKGGGKPGSFVPRRPFLGQRTRQAYAAEQLGEDDGETQEDHDEEELVPEEDGNGFSLDEVLEAEAEALATELEQAEAEGLEPQMLEQVEGTVESAAEALLTMREARHKLQEVRKDRGFGKASSAPSSPQSPSRPGFKKRGVCHDCGQPGHWAGDQGCPKPGAGLARPKPSSRTGGATMGSSPQRRVQLAETFSAEATQETAEPDQYHETAVVTNVGSFAEALEASQPHEVQSAMAVDKRLVGALDSACNRTVCGRFWLEGYLQALSNSPLWQALQPLVKTEPERENFKFGNDGVKASYSRHRLPMVVGQSCVLVWTSVVEVESLGLLLGRDFLEAVGGVISFTRRALRADHLDGSRIPLRQLSAGHFFLDVFPRAWGSTTRPWRREGQDGILEVQISGAEWSLRRAAAVKGVPVKGREHEQLVVEPARETHDGHSGSKSSNSMVHSEVPVFSRGTNGLRKGSASGRKVSKDVPAPPRKKRVALRWASALVAAAAVAALPEQAEAMVRSGGLSRRHFRAAALQNKFEDLGLLKDPMLDGMLAARHTKGVRAAIHGQLVEKLKKEAAEKKTREEQLTAARALLGPKGGLPTLKQDLIRLATLLHVEVSAQDTVEKLKNKLRPTLDALKGIPLQAAPPTTSTTTPAASSAGLPQPPGAPQGHLHLEIGPRTAGPMEPPAVNQADLLQQVSSMMEARLDARDHRLESLLHQTMQHVMAMANSGSQPSDGAGGLSPDSDMGFQQAWNKCKYDRKLVKASPQNIYEAFAVMRDQIYDEALHEPFLHMQYVPRPGDRHPLVADLCKLATARGHAVGRQPDATLPYFLMLRAPGRSPFLNYSRGQARLAAEKKILDAEASVMQSALAHRRSGRHFFLELLRGADPHRTPEGRELMDEPGVFDFSLNGRRYVTSSRAVAEAFRRTSGGNLAEELLDAMQLQFDEDHGPEIVTETLAAETGAEEDELLEGLGGMAESDDEDLEQGRDPGTEIPIPTAVRQAVRRLHENTGHRSPLRLARALVIAGAPPEAVIAAKQLRCSVCEERRPPKARRPASLPGPREPGEQIALDIFDAFDAAGSRYSILHAVDGATKFQMAVLVENKSSAEVIKFLRERWAPIFGMPKTLVCDQGREFISIELEDFASQNNVFVYHIAVQAPWQNGLCERVGGLLKALLGACAAAQSLMGFEEMSLGLGEAVQAYNMDVGDSGFSPMQAAVGRQPLPPGDALAEGRLGEIEAMGQPTFARLVAVRETARMAMLRLHFSRALRRAELTRSRNPTVADDRRKLLLKRWHGPALLVAYEGNGSLWFQMVVATKNNLREKDKALDSYLQNHLQFQLLLGAANRVVDFRVQRLCKELVTNVAVIYLLSLPEPTGTKRPAEVEAETLRSQGSEQVPFDALVLEKEVVLKAAQAREGEVHPLVKLQAQVAMDKASGEDLDVPDHGTWDGRWPLPSRTQYEAFVKAGLKWPTGREALTAQAARKEYHWRSMTEEQKAAFRVASEEAWNVWVRNDAIETLSEEETAKTIATLKQRGEMHKILTPRFVYVDKNESLRTVSNELPLKASARLVVPGYKDVTAFDLRKDAPTASRTSQHLLFTLGSSNFKKGWRTGTADVKSAFLKGERYLDGRIVKGVFGLSDAPREWYLRLKKSVKKERWVQSTMDAATFFLWSKGPQPELIGMMCCHVDDLLISGNAEDSFVYCGKKVDQDLNTGVISVSMEAYVDNLVPIRVAASRRRDMEASLTPGEMKQLRALVGSLQWLVAQVRADMGYHLSVLQSESPTVGTMLKANVLVKEFKATKDFMLKFRPMDLLGAGIVVVSDASLGNVTRGGAVGDKPLERVYSQSCYCVLLAERSLLSGDVGKFTLLDYRSHRLQRVCRSTFAAELLGVEEGFDVGQYCRGHWAEALGYDLAHKGVDCILDTVGLVVVTDAKDTFDKGNSDTPSYGSQKSLAFSIAWLRGMLGKPNVSLRWTETSNMFVDAGTKDMCGSHMRDTLAAGEWSFRYNVKFVKQTIKAKPKVRPGPEVVSGEEVGPTDPVLGFLQGLATKRGWHRRDGLVIQVAHGAKSYRSPEPRFDAEMYPVRTSYALFHDQQGRGSWRILERDVRYGRFLRSLDREAAVLITVFKTPKEEKINVEP
ncbi:RE2 [Symbiodinium sp. CCMP2592]|nr:RE2 [Symbiodinium sp. CCMP2592]